MTRAQRGILLIYCLLVVYCCVWVPWVTDAGSIKDIHEGYGWVWSPPSRVGVPSLAAIATRILAATAASGAAFLLAGKWKALLFIAVLAISGSLMHGYWQDRSSERRARTIHDCAITKMATAKCTPPDKNGLQVCDAYTLFENTEQEEKLFAAAENECRAETGPNPKSIHQQIEEYKHQHEIKE